VALLAPETRLDPSDATVEATPVATETAPLVIVETTPPAPDVTIVAREVATLPAYKILLAVIL